MQSKYETVQDIIADRDRIRSECVALRKDAERYRWLRDRSKTRLRIWSPNENDIGARGPLDKCHLDEEIDAQMSGAN